MKKLYALFSLGIASFAFAQFTSPGNGTSYTLSTLSSAAPTVLVNNGNDYTMAANITISAGDNLIIDENTTLKFNSGIQLSIAGNYTTTADEFTVTATNPAVVFKGILFDATSTADVKNTTFEYGGGIRVSTGNFVMDSCTVRYFKSDLVTGSAISFSTGNPVVKNSTFLENDLPSVSSGANQSVALTFENNYLYGNTKLNSNRPQVNMGPSGSGTTKILNNVIIGNRSLDKVGGVSASTLLGVENHVQIEGNIIKDNRYGITVTGNNSTGSISNNIIENNNTETAPLSGGSGIALSGSGSTLIMDIDIFGNQIRGNLWGVTIYNVARANLGDETNHGNNVFANNGNSGLIYALYNNSAGPISAVGNCWRENELSDDAMVAEVVWDKADNPSLGEVDYTPYNCAETLAVSDTNVLKAKIYPNPSKGNFTLETEKSGNYIISDLSGRLLHSGTVGKGKNNISAKLTPGIYILVYQSEGKKVSEKIIIQ